MTVTALTIDALIQRDLPAARGGDAVAYGRIVSACQNTVTAVALAITRDVGASEDIAQEAFFNAWQRLDSLHSPDSFLPWLRQITRNLARDWLRAQHGRPMSGEVAEIAIGMAADPDATAYVVKPDDGAGCSATHHHARFSAARSEYLARSARGEAVTMESLVADVT